MEENQVSLTAIMTAYLRSYHSRFDSPKIFDDFLAYQLIPEKNRSLIEAGFINSVKLKDPEFAAKSPDLVSVLQREMPGFAGLCHTLNRSRFTEDSLEEAIKQGVKQYVILGAGLDTFAFRRRELLDRLQLFEVDHPAMQAFKRRRLQELGWDVPKQLHFIPMDFNRDSLSQELLKSPYNPEEKSLFSWLGVSMYLTRDAILNTLRTISQVCAVGSHVIFDYLDKAAFKPEKASPRIQRAMFMAKFAGEPMQTGFDPEELAVELDAVGLHLVENLIPSEAQRLYFEGTPYLACEHHYCCKAVKR